MQSKTAGVLLSHPGCGPFIQQVGRALNEGGHLEKFCTTLSYRPASVQWQLGRQLGKLAGLDLDRLLANRRISELPHDLVHTNSWRELLRTVINRIDHDGRLTDMVWEWGELAFDRWVAGQIQPGLAAVYGYEHAALATFQRAKALKIPCIYELPAPAPAFVSAIFAKEYSLFPKIKNSYTNRLSEQQTHRTERRQLEGELADLVIVNSKLTRDSFVAEGLDASKIHVIPLGAPPISNSQRQVTKGNSLRIIWAGSFSLRKGAHHLLAAWKHGALDRRNVVLDVYGTPTLPAKLFSNLPANIKFHGPVPQTELYAHFLQSDLLVLPTLCDGFGMVVTEAMAHGLPVLTTPNAGAAQFIKHGENGILVPVGNIEALSTAISGLLTAHESLHDMGIAAQRTAAAWQWSDFRAAHRQVIDSFLSSRPA